MNKTTRAISNRLSLRTPQEQSLELFSGILEVLSLEKNADLEVELEEVKALCPTCTDFERDFPSICFALATGVGKTRLMGAFIAYLTLRKKIMNYFVLAPNLTIYEKLIDDLGNPAAPKYVFRGIGEFAQTLPRIITGDNYNTRKLSENRFLDSLSGVRLFGFENININIFNISKINAETKGGKEPRIKRLSEYIGESYFEYLSGLDDLVLIMDESHHYRADRGMAVLNELNPVLGIELTATPQIQQGSRKTTFRNVVYDCPLGCAMRDGYVKEPAVATRKDFNPANYSDEELNAIKIEDGMRIHEATKLLLDIFARDNNLPVVKPFVLIVAKDTKHSARLLEKIRSPHFFNGYYADKVMEINSVQGAAEKDENVRKLLTVEDAENPVEIVIHVNMLKEGWDVTNLYTIIPLRRSASDTLTEQTIGRGLRLPYGKRTGTEAVDKLTIVSHDKFQEIIEEANKPGSLINTTQVIFVDDMDLPGRQEVITSKPEFESVIDETIQKITGSDLPPEEKQKQILLQGDIPRAVNTAIHSANIVHNSQELKSEKVKRIIVESVKKKYEYDLFRDDVIEKINAVYDSVVEYKVNK